MTNAPAEAKATQVNKLLTRVLFEELCLKDSKWLVKFLLSESGVNVTGTKQREFNLGFRKFISRTKRKTRIAIFFFSPFDLSAAHDKLLWNLNFTAFEILQVDWLYIFGAQNEL